MQTKELPIMAVECCAPVADRGISDAQAATLASVFKALADPSRVLIVNLLANASEPVCVCDFVPELGLSQGTVSFHLKKLLDVGILEREQRGTWAYYSLNHDALGRLGDVFASNEDAR
jgi:ArsR family transcriptional regulator